MVNFIVLFLVHFSPFDSFLPFFRHFCQKIHRFSEISTVSVGSLTVSVKFPPFWWVHSPFWWVHSPFRWVHSPFRWIIPPFRWKFHRGGGSSHCGGATTHRRGGKVHSAGEPCPCAATTRRSIERTFVRQDFRG
jgi:hypothetical protein